MSKYKPIGRKSINGIYKIVYSKEKSRKQYVIYNNRYIKLENYKKIIAKKQQKKIVAKPKKARRTGGDERFIEHQYSTSQKRGSVRNNNSLQRNAPRTFGGLNTAPGFSYKHAPPSILKPIYAYNTSGLSPSQGGNKVEVKTLENSSPVLGFSTTGLSPYQVLPFPKKGGKKKKYGGVNIENYPGKSIILQPCQYNNAVPGGKYMKGGTVSRAGTIPRLSNYRSSELYLSQPDTAMTAPSSLISFSDIFRMR